MRNRFENLITVNDYAKTLKQYNTADKNSMISAEEYAAFLKEQCSAEMVSSLITVKDYAKSLINGNYKTTKELETETNLEKFLSSSGKTRTDAQTLEQKPA